MLPAKEHDKSITSMSFGNPDTLSPAKSAEDYTVLLSVLRKKTNFCKIKDYTEVIMEKPLE